MYRFKQNANEDCQLVGDPEYEPVLVNITDFIIDNSRTYGGRIGVEIELRASEGSRHTPCAVTLFVKS